jgi:hypothetical protein
MWGGFAGPGGDLLFHALRRSTIGAEGFHGRVRDGIGCFAPRYGHQAFQKADVASRISEPLWLCRACEPCLCRRKRVVCVSCREGLAALVMSDL